MELLKVVVRNISLLVGIVVIVVVAIGGISCNPYPKKPDIQTYPVEDTVAGVVVAIKRYETVSGEDVTVVYFDNKSSLELKGYVELEIGASYEFDYYNDQWNLATVRAW